MIGKLIQAFRKQEDLPLRQVAAVLGISKATLSRIENGKPCDQETMLKLLNWLFKGTA